MSHASAICQKFIFSILDQKVPASLWMQVQTHERPVHLHRIRL